MKRRLLHACMVTALLAAVAVVAALLAQRPAWKATERANALVAQAQELAMRGEPAAAAALVAQALVADPRNVRALREQAMQYVAQGKQREAAEQLVTVAELAPRDPAAAWEAAFALRRIDDTRRALYWFRRVVAEQPHNGVAHALIAHALLQLGDIDGATDEAEQGVWLAPRTPMTYLVLGQVRMEAGDFVAAKAAFTEVLAMRPSEVSVMLTLAQLCVLMKQQHEASGYLARALDIARTDPKARAAVARVLGR